jgi:hypothetical protein
VGVVEEVVGVAAAVGFDTEAAVGAVRAVEELEAPIELVTLTAFV